MKAFAARLDRTGTRRWIWATVAFYGIYLIALVGAVVTEVIGSADPGTATVPGIVLFSLLGLGLAIRASTHRRLDRRTRRAWRLVSASFVLLLAVPVLFAVSSQEDFPTPGDLARLAFMPTLLAGLLMFPLRSASRKDRAKMTLDVATIVAGCFMVLWYLVIGPQLSTSGTSIGSIATAAAYPVGDLALIFGLATVLLRGADPSTQRSLSLVGLAVGFFIVDDVYIGYVQSHPSSTDHTAWQFLCLMTAHFLLAAAAFEQCRQAGAHELKVDHGRRIRPPSKLPYGAVVLGYLLMLTAAGMEQNIFPWSGLVLGGVTITALVVARQVMVQRESHEMAVTDALTGLANRSRLHDALSRALARGERSDHVTAALVVDMNGFKQVNDTLGHKAGDQLLVAFGEIMRRNVLGSDLVGRLGGDEFGMILHNIGGAGNAVAVTRRIVAEMEQPILIEGTLVAPRASFGIALAAPGELDTDELLHRADVAMYYAKRRKITGWEFYDATMAQADTSVNL